MQASWELCARFRRWCYCDGQPSGLHSVPLCSLSLSLALSLALSLSLSHTHTHLLSCVFPVPCVRCFLLQGAGSSCPLALLQETSAESPARRLDLDIREMQRCPSFVEDDGESAWQQQQYGNLFPRGLLKRNRPLDQHAENRCVPCLPRCSYASKHVRLQGVI